MPCMRRCMGSENPAPGSMRALAPLLWGRFLRSATQGCLGVIVPLSMLAHGYRASAVGVLLTAAVAGGAALTLVVGVIADRIGRKPVLVACGGLSAVGATLFALHSPFIVLVIAAIVGTIGQGGGVAAGGAFGPYYPAEQALIAELAGDQLRTQAFARLSLIGAVGGIIGTAATGVVESDTLFWATAGASLLMALVVLPVPERRTRTVRIAARMPLSRETAALLARFIVTNATNGLAIGFLGPILVLWFHVRYGVGAGAIAVLYAAINALSVLSYLGVDRVVTI